MTTTKILELPTFSVKHFDDMYLRADDISVQKYCTERGMTMIGYTSEPTKFSNDGAHAYQYWNNTSWVQEYGYASIVTSITCS